eukprot:CAMPEP_0198148338 /NCGR_PEP_ID=MMETSP1443-20131203/40885_1 /TAXON_ID=186043 /ORGANISM="Entomoneis sp., Strain CCMP2396" /LENGTH=161 /DNA_ID=CAMNT_0043812997 /DNA_START=214 /DNA_END=696 /DNA_ORIENTATION=+
MKPSLLTLLASFCTILCRTSSGIQPAFMTSKRITTCELTLLTFWPPAPDERMNENSILSSAMDILLGTTHSLLEEKYRRVLAFIALPFAFFGGGLYGTCVQVGTTTVAFSSSSPSPSLSDPAAAIRPFRMSRDGDVLVRHEGMDDFVGVETCLTTVKARQR